LGREGERLAEKYLRRRGFKTVVRRFATPVGELDLVMLDGQTVVFVEVKTLRSRQFADPQDAIDREKIGHLARAARWFLQSRRWYDRPCRFDAVAVTVPVVGDAEIEHFPDAFEPPTSWHE